MIRCPKCNGKLRATQTLNVPVVNKLVRRRKCTECGASFLTEEVILYYGDKSKLEEVEIGSGEFGFRSES